jgi:hypothetical protein
VPLQSIGPALIVKLLTVVVIGFRLVVCHAHAPLHLRSELPFLSCVPTVIQ